jgi:glycosyltransferase involved in cell wall biosynthesis
MEKVTETIQKKHKILIVSQHFYPENFRINEMASRLSHMGHDVSVLTGQPNYPQGTIFENYKAWSFKNECYEGVNIYRIPLFPRKNGRALFLMLNYLSFIVSGCVFGFWKLRGEKFDVIFVYGTSPILQTIPAIFISCIKRAKLITWVQDLWPESLSATGFIKNKKVLWFVEKVVQWIYRRSDLILGQSLEFIDEIAKLVPEMNQQNRIQYLPNPAEEKMAHLPMAHLPMAHLPMKHLPMEHLNIKASNTEDVKKDVENNFVLLFAGNLGLAQNLPMIVGLAKRLKKESISSIKIHIAGNGSQKSCFESEVVKHELNNILFLGQFSADEMPAVYSSADALLVTLADEVIYRATIPSKIPTYLATGKPIIGAISGAGKNILEQANVGFSSEANDLEQLFDNVISLFKLSKEEQLDLGIQGRLFFEKHFHPESVAQKMISYF